MERAPWNAAPARWPVRTLLLLGLLLSLFVVLLALAALVDWVGGHGAAVPGRGERPSYAAAYDRRLGLAPYLEQVGGSTALVVALAAPPAAHCAFSPAGRAALPRRWTDRPTAALCAAS
jgi:hypothetical protein